MFLRINRPHLCRGDIGRRIFCTETDRGLRSAPGSTRGMRLAAPPMRRALAWPPGGHLAQLQAKGSDGE